MLYLHCRDWGQGEYLLSWEKALWCELQECGVAKLFVKAEEIANYVHSGLSLGQYPPTDTYFRETHAMYLVCGLDYWTFMLKSAL